VNARSGLSDQYAYHVPSHPWSNDQPSEGAGATFPQLLDMETVARWLGTSIRHVRRLVTERKIPYLKIGHFIRFDERDVEVWIDRQKVVGLDNAVETRVR
jgi:excisionase family DNA binding protein